MPEEGKREKYMLLGVFVEGDDWVFEALPFCPKDVLIGALEEFLKAVKEDKLTTTLGVKVGGETVIKEKLPDIESPLRPPRECYFCKKKCDIHVFCPITRGYTHKDNCKPCKKDDCPEWKKKELK